MSQLAATRIFNAMKGLLSGLDSTDDSLIKRVLGIQWTEKVAVTDAGTSATAVGTTPFWTNDLGCNVQVVAAKFIGSTTVPGQATHTTTMTLSKIESTGTTATTIGTYTSDASGGTATASVPKSLTLTASAVVLAAGDTLRIAASKAGSGVAIGTSTAPSYVAVTLEKVT
jgi:hypothetical protein